ncbi:MAG: hypothetical protein QXK93_06795 [Candidatus Bathyarchaeia archaeon]
MNKTPFAYLFTVFLLLGLFSILASIPNNATAEENGIIVEEAEYISWNSSIYPDDLISKAHAVTPRILIEYVDKIIQQYFYKSSELNSAARAVTERIIVEYADSIFDYGLQAATFPNTPLRIIVEYADSIISKDLLRPPSPLTSPPITNLTLHGDLGLNGWFTSSVAVNMSTNVPVKGTEYSFDNITWLNFTSPFTLNEEGYHRIYYRSIDTAGNIEQTKEEIIKIDKTPPIGYVQINAGAEYTDSRKVTLTLNAVDNVSDVSQMRFFKYGSWTKWEPFTTQKSWNLSLSDQNLPVNWLSQNITVTIRAQFMNNAGLMSNASDTIIFTPKVPTPVSLNKPNVTTTASYYSALLSWSQSTDPDFLCYQVIISRQPLQPSTGYVDDWFFEEMQGQLIYDRSITSYKIEKIPTSIPKYYFTIRTYNNQWIYSDSNAVIAEFSSVGPGPTPLSFISWSLEIILAVISSIFGIGAVCFVSRRIYLKRKGVIHTKGKVKHPWLDLFVGGVGGLIPIFLWLHFYPNLSILWFVIIWGINLILNSILFNTLVLKKTTVTRRLVAIMLYLLYFSLLIYTFYSLSGGTVLQDPMFIAFAIALFIPVINTLACLVIIGLQLYSLYHVTTYPSATNVPILVACISLPLYSFSLTYKISQKLHYKYKVSQSAIIPKLIEKAKESYNMGKLVDAAEQYAKALLKGLKINYEYIDVLLDWYIYLAKNIIFKAIFSGRKEDKENFERIVRLQRMLKSDEFLAKPPQAGDSSKLALSRHQFSKLDMLIEKAQANDLDFVVHEAIQDKEFLPSFLEKISVSEMEIIDLADRLGYDREIVKKLLQKCIQKGKVQGYLTLDEQKFISKFHVRNKLKEILDLD